VDAGGTGINLRGTVTDSERRPLGGVRVTALAGGDGSASALTKRDGTFELRGLRPGQYRVLAARPGYTATAERAFVGGNAPPALEFRLKRVRPEVAERALVKLGSTGGSGVKSGSAGAGNKQTGAAGGSKPGATGSTKPGAASAGTLTPGGAKQPTAVSQRSGQVRGLVTDAKTGRPLAGVTLTVAGRPSVMTRHDGSYALSLPPGSHRLVVRKNDFAEATIVVRVAGGGAVTQNIKLAPRPSAPPHRPPH
jgi:hypothetical protein